MIPCTKKRVFFILLVTAIIAFLIRLAIHHGSLLTEERFRHLPGAPVLVTVFYEALCPDSKHFIMKQLVPAHKAASQIMDIVLVPYGKATTYSNSDGSFRFDCQHGPVECQANIYHACAIEIIEDPQARLNVVSCMIKDNRLPKEAIHKCTKEYNIESIDLIQKCFDSSNGNKLLKLNGDITRSLRPTVSFIPTITLDGSQGRQPAVLKNLLAEVCKIAKGNKEAEKICKNI